MQLHSHYMESFMQMNSTMPGNINIPSSSTRIVCPKPHHLYEMCNNCSLSESSCVHGVFPGTPTGVELSSCFIHISPNSGSDHTSSFQRQPRPWRNHLSHEHFFSYWCCVYSLRGFFKLWGSFFLLFFCSSRHPILSWGATSRTVSPQPVELHEDITPDTRSWIRCCWASRVSPACPGPSE